MCARVLFVRAVCTKFNTQPLLLFIIKIVHEVQQEKLKYTKETEQYTALRYQSPSTNAIYSCGNLISIKQISAQIRIVPKKQHILQINRSVKVCDSKIRGN